MRLKLKIKYIFYNIKYIFSNYTNFELKKSHLYVITFTGGLGAQIISSAIYFYLKKKNIPVVANLSYFKNKEISNKANSYSIWNWELDSFNIFMNDFDENFPKNSTRIIKVNDGLLKIKLFLEALKIVKIRERFKIDDHNIRTINSQKDIDNYICIHMRRGDYLNVASYIISDEKFISILKKFKNNLPNLIVLSDSLINSNFKIICDDMFEKTYYLDNLSTIQSFKYMINARILICSNSQFSLTAGLLNHNGLVIIPDKWFGDNTYNSFVSEKLLNNLSEFNIIS